MALRRFWQYRLGLRSEGAFRGVPTLILLALGCAPQIPYRYTPGPPPHGVRGTFHFTPRAKVGDVDAAVRGLFPVAHDCVLWFDATGTATMAEDWVPFIVVSGEIRLFAHGSCGESFRGRVGVERRIVLSTDEQSPGRFLWCEGGEVLGSLTSDGTISSLHDMLQVLEHQSVALAAWSTDDAHQALAIIQRFHTAGISLLLVDDGQRTLRAVDGHHGCAPGLPPPD